ncbi:MAG: right-handed parallel beta-helix repeat-containing protein [Planctomycetes bacterium]|nr:right-handed parallel beta-helix repeat-containing protein [Planctomycetota bacterium]
MRKVVILSVLVCSLVAGAAEQTLSFNPVDDTFIRKNDPNETNGSDNFMRLKGDSQIAYLKFTVTGVSGSVLSAQLKLHCKDNPIDDTSVYAVTGQWDEATLSWGTDDLVWGGRLDTRGPISPNTWHEFEVSDQVNANGVFSFGLKTTQKAGGLKYDSSESDNPPVLLVTTGPPPPLPGKATGPDPADLAADVDTATDLSWTAGSDAVGHYVYFGTSENEVGDANSSSLLFMGKQFHTTYEPGIMETRRGYYWRIDEKNISGTTEGNVWSFTTRLHIPTMAQCDLVRDGFIDPNDLTGFAMQWTAKGSIADGWCSGADLNRSDRVDNSDLGLLSRHWKKQVPGFYVAPDGNDGNPGTAAEPFLTIQKAADTMTPGDTCYIRGGVYRETVNLSTSGAYDSPISFVAYRNERVVLDGTDVLDLSWSVHSDNIYKATTDKTFEQLFLDDEMMVEARWPNMQFPSELWDMSRWATADVGSRYGEMVDSAMASTGIDWTGAVAVLNVAHQFYTWTRTVSEHTARSDTFLYPQDLSGITSYATKTTPWENDRYFLMGKLEALDSPGEWFLDDEANTLYVWTPDGTSPAGYTVEVKQRNYGFEMSDGADYIEISGFDFFGCTFVFTDSDHCLVADCNLVYPVYTRLVDDPSSNQDKAFTRVLGDDNKVENCKFGFSSTIGLKMVGRKNVAENNLIHDVSWYGSLKHVALNISSNAEAGAGEGCTARNNTLFNMGNAALNYRGYQNLVEYNHVYDGGIACEDVALVYTGQPTTAGSIVRYNWVHGCRTQSGKGLGIRGDDQTRSLTVHHNVVWNCGRDGIIVKGDLNKVYNNTVFDIGTVGDPGNYINMHTAPEPYKWWREQYPLLDEQNVNSTIYNNAALTITSDNNGTPFPPGDNLADNYYSADLKLADQGNFNFMPDPDSALVDAGRVIDGYIPSAPDIGAYEYASTEYWIPGRKSSRASMPIPPDGAAGVSTDVVLIWRAGYKATSHDVYLGSSKSAVANANRGSGQYKGNQTANIFDPPGSSPATTYYWRIDVIDAGGNIKARGDVWSFTTQ